LTVVSPYTCWYCVIRRAAHLQKANDKAGQYEGRERSSARARSEVPHVQVHKTEPPIAKTTPRTQTDSSRSREVSLGKVLHIARKPPPLRPHPHFGVLQTRANTV
jgi:hypothetical protein